MALQITAILDRYKNNRFQILPYLPSIKYLSWRICY